MISQNEVERLFEYRDGVLYWKVRNSNRISIGSPTGTINGNRGYLCTRIDGKKYLNHRLIFLYHHGYMPENMIDHIDRNTLNNRIENLREINQQCNMRNARQHIDNTSGVKGICWHKKTNKWYAQIVINQKLKNFGYYPDFTEAVAHRLAAEQCINWNGCDSCSPAYLYMQNYLKNNR